MVKKPQLAINTATAPPPPSGITVTETGSLRGDGISVSMQGLRIADGGSGSQPTPASSSSEGGSSWLSAMDVEHVLGEGSSGLVKLVRHRASKRRYALKVIPLGCAEQERKQILIELKTLHKSDIGSIISFHDAFYAEGAVHVVLEYMDCGSLADVLQRHGPLPERLLSKISHAVLTGLVHLHQELKTVHRDIKPSNLLLNSKGQAKIGDFGMSGQLASSFSRLASWVGTAAYMSPERISATDYSFEADIWSLGISLWECAVGRYPHGKPADGGSRPGSVAAGTRPDRGGADGAGAPAASGGGSCGGGGKLTHSLLPEEQRLGLSFWDLLHCIVESEPPPLPAEGKFTPHFTEFVDACLAKECAARPAAAALLSHPWLTEQQPHLVDISTWLQKTFPDD